MISTLLKFVKMCIITQNIICSGECSYDREKNVHLLLLDKVFYKHQFDPVDDGTTQFNYILPDFCLLDLSITDRGAY